MNEYYEQWYELSQTVNEMVLSSTKDNRSDGLTIPQFSVSPETGAAAVTVGITLAGVGLIRTKHPAAMAVGAGLIALPDPVVYAVAYSILS